MSALTDLAITRIRPKAGRFDVPDPQVPGLRLTVLPSGVKTWSTRYTFNGRDRRLTLGKYPTIKLADARKLAGRALRDVAAGHDPQLQKVETRRKAQAGLDDEAMFGAIFERYMSEHVRPKLKPSTSKEMDRLANTIILPKFKRRRLSEIAPHDVKALMAAQRKRGAPIQANKVFATLRSFFNWCRRELLLTVSPCAGLQKTEVERPRERVLTDREVAWLWRACDQVGFPFGPMTKLLLLTGARRNEVALMARRELDRDECLWTLPPARTKNSREHSIHLTDAALAIIDSLPKIRGKSDLLFTTTGESSVSGFSRAKARLDELMAEYAAEDGEEISPWVIHDLRRTVASGMARLGIALPVIERALNHVSGSFAGIVGVYQRHEFTAEKRAAFEAWANHCAKLVQDRPEMKR